MKKSLITMLAVCAFVFTACTPKQQSSSASPSQLSSSAPSQTQSSSAPAKQEELTVLGIIQEASNNIITVDCSLGTLTFVTDDADKSQADGLIIGTEVTIYYTGDIKGTDTSAAKVTKLTQEKGSSVESSVDGVIESVSSDKITVKADIGTLSFNIKDADTTKAKMLKKDAKVRIYYLGNIKALDTATTKVTRLEQDVLIEAGSNQSVIGIIVDATMNSITVKTESGTMSFNTNSADMSKAGGLITDSEVTVYYKDDPNAPTSDIKIAISVVQPVGKTTSIVGTITGSDDYTVTVISAEGHYFTFVLGNARKDGVSLKNDTKIKLTYTGKMTGEDASTVQLVSIEQA